MYIGKYTVGSTEQYWVESDTIECIIAELENLIGAVVNTDNIEFYKANPIKVNISVKYIITEFE